MSIASATVQTPPPSGDMQTSRMEVNATWLVRLRWVAVVGQLLTVGFAELILDVRLRLIPVLALVAFTAATNLALVLLPRNKAVATSRRSTWLSDHRLLGVVMTIDLVSLTALLYWSGGPQNPFALFYFVNLALAAVVLPPRWTWPLTAIASACFVGLFFDHVELVALARPLPGWFDGRAAELDQIGLVVAFVTCATVIVYFITRVTGELRARELDLRTAERRQARGTKLEALATLAAGTAHELASPLSTIAVVVKELTMHLEGADVPQTVVDDVRLIRSELDRCRSVLDSMAASAGQSVGGAMIEIKDDALIQEILVGLSEHDRRRVRIERDSEPAHVVVPLGGIAQAIRGIVRNALDASDPDANVILRVARSDERLRLVIRDQGSGMSSEVMSRAAEPFFTTKEPGKGMGLGLFLAISVLERLGGTLTFESEASQGTTALVELPMRPSDAVDSDSVADGTPKRHA